MHSEQAEGELPHIALAARSLSDLQHSLVYSRCRLALSRGCLMHNGFTVEKNGLWGIGV